MKCPKCGSEVQQHEASVLYGISGETVEVLASGEFVIAFCCGIAVMAEKPKEQPKIITPPQQIILPNEQNNPIP